MQDTIRGVDIGLHQLRVVDNDLLRSCDDLEMVSLHSCDYMHSEYWVGTTGGGNLRFTPGSNDSDQTMSPYSTACQLRILSRLSMANMLLR